MMNEKHFLRIGKINENEEKTHRKSPLIDSKRPTWCRWKLSQFSLFYFFVQMHFSRKILSSFLISATFLGIFIFTSKISQPKKFTCKVHLSGRSNHSRVSQSQLRLVFCFDFLSHDKIWIIFETVSLFFTQTLHGIEAARRAAWKNV